jgi:hypothetical protein
VRGCHGIESETRCIGVFVGRDVWAMRYQESSGRDGWIIRYAFNCGRVSCGNGDEAHFGLKKMWCTVPSAQSERAK